MSARRSLVLALVAAGALAVPASAGAVIGAATTIDGPSADIVGLDGVALAPDGSGGLVYRKRVDGRVHVFVARYADRRWHPPQRVDAGQRFDSSWPAIGAGDGGRLVVTWIHQYGGGVQNRMFSASLDPGARTFQAPVAIDLDVREGLDAAPSLAMSPGGAAYLAYRVVYLRQSPELPSGTVDADYRLQRYSGSFWSQLGQPLDRVQSQPQAAPTALNGPQAGVDAGGNAVVAWQEPDDALIPRVYVRRVFGQVLGNVLQASPADAGGAPLRAPADQLSLAVAPFGEAIVGFRQQPDSQGGWTRPRALVNMLPSSFAEGAGRFIGARPVDGGGGDGPLDVLGPVSVSVDDGGAFDVGVGVGAGVLGVGGDEATVAGPVRLDDGSGQGAPDPLVVRGREGTLAAAWRVDQTTAAGVGLLERRADGTPFQRTVSAAGGGAVQTLKLGGTDLGSALVAFLQGREGGQQIAAAPIDVPPGRFTVATPAGWTRAQRIPLTWEAAPSATGRITYDVQLDGADVATGLRRLARTLKARDVGDGAYEVTVVATDAAGQTATSIVSELRVDRSAPQVRIARRGARGVRVRVVDGAKGQSSGVGRVTIAWGDGRRARGRRPVAHRYAEPGRHRVSVRAADRAGNVRTERHTVVVR